jgi:hypothetical protein
MRVMKPSEGFTVIELLVAIVFFSLITGVFFTQRETLLSMHRDQDRKIAINAIYYDLTEVVKPALGGYPRVLDARDLSAMDPGLLNDMNGRKIGDQKSDYHYQATECNGSNLCSGFTLRADLEREPDFVKQSY